MELGGAGEALFVEEEDGVSLPPVRHLEPSDSSAFLDPDSALSFTSDPQLSNIDCSPQIINKQLDIEKAQENHEPVPKYAYEQPVLPSVDVDVLNSTTMVNNRRRRSKRSSINITNKQSSEEEDQEVEKIYSSILRRSRNHQRDPTPTSLHENLSSHNDSDKLNSSDTAAPKRSASENDLPFFPIDDDKNSESSTPFVDAHSRMNSIDSRKKVLIIPPRLTIESDDEDQESYSSSPEEEEMQEKTTRTLSNPIPIEQKVKDEELIIEDEQPNTLINTIFSQSAPSANVRISQSTETNNYLLSENFSPSLAFTRFGQFYFFSSFSSSFLSSVVPRIFDQKVPNPIANMKWINPLNNQTVKIVSVLLGNGNGANYPNNVVVFFVTSGHHHQHQNNQHRKKASISMI